MYKLTGQYFLRLGHPHDEGTRLTLPAVKTLEVLPLIDLDDLAYAVLSPSIRWERTKTLGRGDDCCDFRWSRGEPRKDMTGLIQVQSGVRR